MRPAKKYAFARAIVGFLFGASAIVGIADQAAAHTRFDGLWSVAIVTEQGSCQRGYRYPVAIVNGIIEQAPEESNSSFAIAGRVATSGAVRVSVRSGDQLAHGSGRLRAAIGQGRWTSPTSGCAGYWTAERRRYRQDPAYR